MKKQTATPCRLSNDRTGLPQVSEDERGIILVITVILIVGLISVVAFTLLRSRSNVILSEAQSTADAAAHAGVLSLCSSRECYVRARAAALEMVNQHTIHGTVGQETKTNFTEADANGVVWESDLFRVTIQRGRWLPNGLPVGTTPRFEPFESDEPGFDWQAENPGIPAYTIANAVRVSIERRNLKDSIFGDSTSALVSDAIAARNPGESIEVAPFAIPICSLLDEEGEFHPRRNCTFDRFFARSDRYCSDPTDNDDCRIVPKFPHDTVFAGDCFTADSDFYWKNSGNYSIASAFQNDCRNPMIMGNKHTNTCGWLGPRHVDLQDHFGVIGLPVSSITTFDEDTIRDTILDQDTPLVPAAVGEEFKILADGFSDPQTNEVIKKHLFGSFSNAGESDNPDAVRYDRIYNRPTTPFDFGYTPQKQWLGAAESGTSYRGPSDSPLTYDDYFYCDCKSHKQSFCTDFQCDEGFFQPAQAGLCRSSWGTLSYSCGFRQSWCEAEGCASRPCGPTILAQVSDPPDRFWRIPVAVIAEVGANADPCKGSKPTITEEAKVSGNKRYEIVGFLNITVFDTDIGSAPLSRPNTADVIHNEMDPGPFRPPAAVCGDSELDWVDEWGFSSPAGGGCNTFVAKTDCFAQLIAAESELVQTPPLIVE